MTGSADEMPSPNYCAYHQQEDTCNEQVTEQTEAPRQNTPPRCNPRDLVTVGNKTPDNVNYKDPIRKTMQPIDVEKPYKKPVEVPCSPEYVVLSLTLKSTFEQGSDTHLVALSIFCH